MNETKAVFTHIDLQTLVPYWSTGFPDFLCKVYDDTLEYVLLAFFTIFHILLAYVCIGVFIYAFLRRSSELKEIKRVLFIIAHPDDECMFFGPTIIKLREKCDLYLLCLSDGNNQKRGIKRRRELWESCKVLGIPAANITLIRYTDMPDDPKVLWDEQKTAKVILNHIETFEINEVYTFDIGGVSGHLNHASIFYAFAYLCLRNKVPFGCKVYLLDSVNLVRKYSFFLDANLSGPVLSKHAFIISFSDAVTLRVAMRQHRSQLVWFRYLYIYLSRYMYINTYKELDFEDVQLVLQLSDHNLFD